MLHPDPNLAVAPPQALQVLLASLQVVQVGNDLGEDGCQEPGGVLCLGKGVDALAVSEKNMFILNLM